MAKYTKTLLTRFLLIFVILFILTLPFEQPIIPILPGILATLFEGLSYVIAVNIFDLDSIKDYKINSDSPGLYISVSLILILASTVAFIWTFFDRKELLKTEKKLLSEISSFYLSMHLFAYGFSKIFKVQFFYPEPNTLFTPIGYLNSDILFWSAMGSSYVYTVFSGFIEIIPAILLIFKKTRLLGALFSFGVMLNVLFLNIGFDISVKVFSAFLLLLSAVLIRPQAKNLYLFFMEKNVKFESNKRVGRINYVKYLIPISILIFLIFNGLYPYLYSRNFNDDLSKKTDFYGAYETTLFKIDGVSIPALSTDKTRWKRFFVHRRGYFIIQNMQDNMTDYKLNADKNKNFIELSDYRNLNTKYKFNICENGERIWLQGNLMGKEIYLEANKIDLSKLPLSKRNFHWIVK